jgi:hypothetical protein
MDRDAYKLYKKYKKYKSKYTALSLGGGESRGNPRLIVLVGAGQNWSNYGQYKPETQPPNTVIHVVDPLNPHRGTNGDHTHPDQIRTDLATMNPLNSYYQIPFDQYLQEIVYSGICTDHFSKIIIVSYTEMVSPEIGNFLPENCLFIYDGHGANGLPIQELVQLPLSDRPILSNLNLIRHTTIQLMESQNQCHGSEETWITAENITRYNQTVDQLNLVTSDVSDMTFRLIITLIESVTELLWSVKAWTTGRFLRPGHPINRLQELRTVTISTRKFPILSII